MTQYVPLHLRFPLRAGRLCRLVVLALTCAGCTLPHRANQADNRAAKYDQVNIVYRVRNVQGTVTSRGVEQTSMEDALDSPSADASGRWKTAQLRVEYPHPDAVADMARATLVLSRAELPAPEQPSLGQRLADRFNRLKSHAPTPECQPSAICATSSGPDDEIWVMDFPRQQLDLLLEELGNTGFFASQTRPTGGAELDVAIDRSRTQKLWTTEPRLDDLVTRVFREGMLEGFVEVGMHDPMINDPLSP